MRPLAIAVPLALVPAIFRPSAFVVAVLAAGCGAAMGALGPVANSQFVRRLPAEYRARAFGVIQAGVQLLQGTAVLATGALSQKIAVPVVVGLWSLFGTALMVALVVRWPLRNGLPTPPPAMGAVAGAGGAEAPPPVPRQVGLHRRAEIRPPGTMEP